MIMHNGIFSDFPFYCANIFKLRILPTARKSVIFPVHFRINTNMENFVTQHCCLVSENQKNFLYF